VKGAELCKTGVPFILNFPKEIQNVAKYYVFGFHWFVKMLEIIILATFLSIFLETNRSKPLARQAKIHSQIFFTHVKLSRILFPSNLSRDNSPIGKYFGNPQTHGIHTHVSNTFPTSDPKAIGVDISSWKSHKCLSKFSGQTMRPTSPSATPAPPHLLHFFPCGVFLVRPTQSAAPEYFFLARTTR